ncbi:hypothetical protein ACQPZX_24500 [Actinoplanes sp. CA-142083]|uniref:hypothetical protein n=1 Tax=Actinoplanes sp. CA-142083 TaxID=3239903 RepID=UPI003D92A399
MTVPPELAAVHTRVEAALAGEQDAVLAPGALADAAALAAAARDPGGPVGEVAAATALGWLHWCRYHLTAPGPDAQRSAAETLRHFRLVIDTTPEAVPEDVRATIVDAVLNGADRPAQATLGGALVSAGSRTTDTTLLDQAADLLGAATGPGDPAPEPSWCDHLAGALYLRYERTGAVADLDRAVAAAERAAEVAAAGGHDLARYLTNQSLVLRSRGERVRSVADLGRAVALAREAAALAGTPRERAGCLSNLGIALLARAGAASSPADRAEATDVLRAALRTAPDDDDQRRAYLSNLSSALLSADPTPPPDLEEAIAAAREALRDGPEDDPDRFKHVSNLATGLRRRGTVPDLDEAIAARRQALTLVPPRHPRHREVATDLVADLRRRLDLAPRADDVELMAGTLRAAHDGAPDDPVLLADLASALRMRFAWFGRLGDLDEAVALQRQALGAEEPEPPRWFLLAGLGTALRMRFEHTGGGLADIDESIAVLQEAAGLAPPGHERYEAALSALCGALRTRYDATSRFHDLQDAIAAGARAVAAAADPADAANTLGFALRLRFDRTGEQADLEEAVRLGRIAVAPDGRAPGSGALSNLGLALHTRYEYAGALADLNEAISYAAQALDKLPAGSPIRHRLLSNLSIAHWERFRRTENPEDLTDAVRLARAAVDATPAGHPRRPIYLTNLGLTLHAQYESGDRDPAHLAEYVEVQREALDSGAPGDADYTLLLSNLSTAVAVLFAATGEHAHIDEAIALERQAIAGLPPGHGRAGPHWTNLGHRLHARFTHLDHGADLSDAIAAWDHGARITATPVAVRITAASTCAAVVAATSDPGAAADRYGWTIAELLPLLAWRGVGREDQLYQLRTHAGALARDGASCTLAAGRPGEALSRLEQGRAVLWNQVLELRTDLSRLESVAPELARRLAECRRVIDHQATPLHPDA